jgi:DNA polymerase-3 subunit epsilon
VTGRADGGLVRRAADLLRDGPVHTLDLAAEVLGLQGHPGAASAAVFTLLAPDSRFHVDPDGRWSLSPEGRQLGQPLASLRYAVVDVETTGGRLGSGHRMVEIAVVEVRGGAVAGSFETLLNPGRSIPTMVQSLTGITPSMVDGAPSFEHVAPVVAEILEGRVFVAHNVGFDWAFVSRELLDAGADVPSMPRLCTVRMARRLVPELRRRNLDALARHFGVPNHSRHRAAGDALATARVLIRLLDAAERRGLYDLEALQAFLTRRARRRTSHQGELFQPGRFGSDSPPGEPLRSWGGGTPGERPTLDAEEP